MLQIQENYLLQNATTLHIGGPAKKFVVVRTKEELIEAVQYAKQNQLPYQIIGGGSNLLVSDQGTDKLIIRNEITGITPPHKLQLTVSSGTPLQTLVNFTIQNNLKGLQKLTGIPGTLGGAVFGNAGAYGQTISDHLISINVLNPEDLTIKQLTASEAEFHYRDSIFKKKHFIILGVTFQLEKAKSAVLQKEADETLSKRLVKYPPGIKCPGSFFKNIVANTLSDELLNKLQDKIIFGKLPAGALLEAVGAKGQSQKDIEIAPYHANLFINRGKGTAKDFYSLAQKYAQKVKKKFGINLEPEVQFINLPPLL